MLSEPPTTEEVDEFQQLLCSRQWDDETARFNRHLQSKAVTQFTGKGDSHEFALWRNSLRGYFDRYFVNNTAFRASLAVGTFVENAQSWWLAHTSRRPHLVLSLDQLLEWVRIELVPEADPDVASIAWSEVNYEGDLADYFRRVHELSLTNPLPTRQAQILAASRFGTELVTKVRSAIALTGKQFLTRVEWQDIVRSYVVEHEARPSFMEWGRAQAGPVHQKARFAAGKVRTEALCAAPQVEGGSADMCAGQLLPYQGGVLKRGEGPHPCFVCGSANHRYLECSRRKATGCAVCGSSAHRALHCSQRYVPQSWREHPPVAPRSAAPSPANLCVGECSEPIQNTILAQQREETSQRQAGATEASMSVPPPNPASETVVNLDTPTPALTLAQAEVHEPNLDFLAAAETAWVRECWQGEACTKKRLDGIRPLNDPAHSSKLVYRVTIDGIEAAALLDYGAMRSFVDKQFLTRYNLPAKALPTPVHLRLLKGQAPHSVKEKYCAAKMTIATRCTPWEFLVLDGLPHKVVLGMEFVKKMHMMYDPYSDLVFVGGPSDVPSNLSCRETVVFEEGRCEAEEIEPMATFVNTPILSQPPSAITIGDYSLLAYHETTEEQPHICFLSVTASTLDEKLAVEQFRASLPVDLREVVDDAAELFNPPDNEPPERTVKHLIQLLPDTVPIKRRPYPLAEPKLKEMHSQIRALVENSWVEPSSSPWGAPILFVPKKDSALRLCVDYRDLNAVTVDDSFPLPRIEVVLHRAAQASYFSKIDLASGFHQIEVEANSRPLTAFRLPEPVCGSSLWQWKVMPFGLRNAPPTF